MSEPTRSEAPFDLTTERLEAFSDAVIAVIITILALGLELPKEPTWGAIRVEVGSFIAAMICLALRSARWKDGVP